MSSKEKPQIRCAIYTRKSTEEGLDQEFNSLDAQRESAEAYIASQKTEGWRCLPVRYDDGGYTGGNMERPAMQRLMDDVAAGKIDCVVVYKVDRLSRSLMDFARMMEAFQKHDVSFVSVTQQFNTTHSMGRLTLNILFSFAQFEREIISERTRDKIAAARRKGKWSGGMPVLGYNVDPQGSKLNVNPVEAERVRAIFELYLEKQSLIQVAVELKERGWTTKQWTTRKGNERGGGAFDKSNLHRMLTNVVYLGKVRYKEEVHEGEHEAIVPEDVWERAGKSLRLNGRTGGMHIRNKFGALLKGILYCGPCGHAMGHSFTKKSNNCYRYYICYTAQKQGWDACASKSLPAEQIEQFVVDQIKAIGRDPTLLPVTLDQAQQQDVERIEAVESEQSTVEREIKRLNSEIRRVAKGEKPAADLVPLHEELGQAERRATDLQCELETLRGRIVSKEDLDTALAAFDPVWDALSPKEQARVLRLLIRRVEYDGEKGSVSITFHPSGIKAMGAEQDSLRSESAA